MTLEFDKIMALLAWSKENGVQSVRYGEFSAEFSQSKAELSGDDLKDILDKSSDLTPEQYEEILYHSARP